MAGLQSVPAFSGSCLLIWIGVSPVPIGPFLDAYLQ